MTDAADLVVRDVRGHTLARPDETFEAVAVRDGRIVRVDSEYEVDFLVGTGTEVVDGGGRTLLPGFIDAHTHLEQQGQYLVHADLSDAGTLDEAVETLASDAADGEWLLGFGWDESDWPEGRYLTREDLDRVSEDRPVAALRVDMHTAALNSVALDRLREEMPAEDVRTEGGEPTGVVVEDAAGELWSVVDPDVAETRDLLAAARDRAHELGITAVHDMVRESHAPRVYRELAAEDALDLRVRINYWSDHIEAVRETGLTTNSGGDWVQTGAIKSFTDGSLGARTAKLTEPYADADEAEDAEPGTTGEWVVTPEELREIADEADAGGLQLTVHAIGDAAITETLDAFETTEAPGAARHRVEHAEVLSDEQIERFAETGIVASVQPNFLRWADEGGLYDARLGSERRERSNRYRDLLDAGAHVAFGSDCMPMDPLLGVHHAVNAPAEGQRLSVTEALRAYTLGGAYAGFDEGRMGTVEAGKHADFVLLEESPWDASERIDEIDVEATIVGGDLVYDDR